MKSSSNDKFETWLNMLTDEERADVMKTQIQENSQTERKKIEEESRVRDRLICTDGYHVVRGLFVLMLVGVTIAAGVVGYRAVEAWENVKVGHPAQVTGLTDAGAASK